MRRLAGASLAIGLVVVVLVDVSRASAAPDVLYVSPAVPEIAVGTSPEGVAAADLDEDGNLDLVVVNTGDDTLSIRLGDGAGGFTNAPDVAGGTTPRGVAIADLDEDGHLDLAFANAFDDDVAIRLGDGAGGFTGATSVSVGTFPFAVAAVDVNDDDDLDLVVTNVASANVSIRLGDGDGGFAPAPVPEVALPSAPLSMAVADLDDDGAVDFVVVHDGTDSASIRMGDGAGGFAPPAVPEIAVGDAPRGIAIGDIDDDGSPDLLVSNVDSDDVSIRMGDGDGSFSAPAAAEVAVGDAPRRVTTADVNGDGRLDLVTANAGTDDLSIRMGDGAGGFTSPGAPEVDVGDVPTTPVAADFNGDGKLDLAVTNDVGNSVSIRLHDFALAPGAPTAVGAHRGNQRVSVTFSPPASDGGGAITSYTAVATPGGATVSGTGSPLIVTGLANGTSYTFAVTATNAAGTGPSAASGSVVPRRASSSSPATTAPPRTTTTTTTVPTTVPPEVSRAATTSGAAPFTVDASRVVRRGDAVGAAVSPAGGYWTTDAAGSVLGGDGAVARGGTPDLALVAPIVGIASTPTGLGYWLVAGDGGVFTFGDATFFGARPASDGHPIVGLAPRPDGTGYWLVDSAGRVTPFGSAVPEGDTSALRLNQPVVGMAVPPDGRGYWLVAGDGGVFTFGSAPFLGSAVGHSSVATVGLVPSPDGASYVVVGADGSTFAAG